MKIPFSPDQFARAHAALGTSAQASVTDSSPNSGDVHSSDVDFSYSFDGMGSLDVEIRKRNSFLARHASDETIYAHIEHTLSSI